MPRSALKPSALVTPSTRLRLTIHGSLCSSACTEPPLADIRLPSLSWVAFGSTVLRLLPGS